MDENDANKMLANHLKDDMTTTDVLKPYYEKVKHEFEIDAKSGTILERDSESVYDD